MHSSAGLDLGSHRLRLAAAGTIVPLDGQVSSVPCVVEPGRGAMCVMSLKRALASPESGVQEASVEAQLLNRLKSIRAAAGASRLVIAVPGSFSQHRRAKLRDLAASTFDGVRLIDDAAAALHGTNLSGARERIGVLSWGSWGCEAVAFGGDAGLRMIALEHDVDIGADAFDSQTLSDALRGSNTGDVVSLYAAARAARESVLAGTTASMDERVDVNGVRRRVDDSIDRALGLLTKAIGNGADAVFVMGSIATAPAILERLGSVNGALKPMADADAARGASLHAAALPESSWTVPASAATPEQAPPAVTRPSSATKQPARRSVEAERGPQKVARVGRNEKCPCGSGRKYKKCHGT